MDKLGGSDLRAMLRRLTVVAMLMRSVEILISCRRFLARVLTPPSSFLRKEEGPGVRREELKLLAQTIGLFAVVGTSSDGLLALDFRASLGLASGTLCALIPVLYCNLAVQALRWSRGGGDKPFLRNSLLSLGILGLSWAILINLLALVALPTQRGLIDAIMVALVSTPMVAAPLSAAVVFWVPSAVSGVAIIVATNRGFDPYLLVCYLGYASFTLSAIVMFNGFLLERSVGRIILEQQNQTIGMFLRDYEENASDWLWETDADLNLRHVSPRMAEVARRSRAFLDGFPLPGLLSHSDGCREARAIRELFDKRTSFRNLTLKVEIEGEDRWWTLTGRPTFGDGACFQGYRGIGSDVTEARRSEERIRHLAMHDSLTGLGNRQSFMDALQTACGQVPKAGGYPPSERLEGGQRLALHLLDLDRFKSVNDTFGHAVGDALLVAVAGRLRGCTRKESVIARLGGDEFALLSSVADAGEASALAQRVIDTVSVEYALAGGRQSIGVSVGVSFVLAGESAPVNLMREADLALYASKAAGRGVFRLFHQEMNADHHDRLTLQADLKDAISDGDLSLLYQPIVDAKDSRIVSVEALCRWKHPTLGEIPPSRFIPLAEEAGLISQLGAWTLVQACRTASGWPANVRVAVNVSPLQITGGDLEALVTTALVETGIPAARLELEMTEHAYLEATERTQRVMQALRENGSRLVLDDFGTGYSSLSCLTTFGFDGIKIDASFVQDLERSPAKAAVVRAIAQLASDMNVPITVEGVENSQQEEILRRYDVTNLQGYLIGYPVDASRMAQLLEIQVRVDETNMAY